MEKAEDTKINITTDFKCGNCDGTVTTPLPLLRLINYPEFSAMVLAHQVPVKCTCGTMYIPLLGSVDESMKIRFVWKEVRTSTGSASKLTNMKTEKVV